jgi:phosphoserine phosphatase
MAQISFRQRTGSPPSTMTAPCGLSSRCRLNSTSSSAGGPKRSSRIHRWPQSNRIKAIIEKDPAFFVGLANQDPEIVGTLLKAFARSWAGTTPEEFDAQVRVWLDTVKQPKLGKLYVDLVYKPMLELFDLLKAHEFRIFVVSGGGRDFMRVFAEEAFGIHKENVIGTAADYSFSDGKIVRAEQALGGLDVGKGKPEHIFAQTGRLPVFAGGNADVDIEMLTAANFAVLINHDDDEREFAYTNGSEKSLAKAKELGWTIVSMKQDWKNVYN